MPKEKSNDHPVEHRSHAPGFLGSGYRPDDRLLGGFRGANVQLVHPAQQHVPDRGAPAGSARLRLAGDGFGPRDSDGEYREGEFQRDR